MPELPEVETLRRDLQREIANQELARVEVLQPRMTRGQDPETIEKRVQGQMVRAVGRRGKYLLIHLRSSDTLLIHRGMSGNVFLQQPDDSVGIHCHLSIALADRRMLAVYDPRGFGEICLLSEAEIDQRF